MKRSFQSVPVDSAGHLVLPQGLADRLGITRGGQAWVCEDPNGIHLVSPTDRLEKLYVEPTTMCNLGCRTCMRNTWGEPAGRMSAATFQRILDGIDHLDHLPTVFFGGLGEPLSHPDILNMVSELTKRGCRVELITNGTLLDTETSRGIIAAGLERIWISLDQVHEEQAGLVRNNGAFPDVLHNLHVLCAERERSMSRVPSIGLSFVATRDSIPTLPDLLRKGMGIGADRFLVTNVEAYSPEMREQILYNRIYHDPAPHESEFTPMAEICRMELSEATVKPLLAAVKRLFSVSAVDQRLSLGGYTCPFVERRSASIRWDGGLSPCLPLLHAHTSWLDDRERHIAAHIIGSMDNQELGELWNDPSFRALRDRLQTFDFPPCTQCNGCEMADSNQEDCFNSPAPVCGGCLWAQGFIRCP